MMHYIYAIYDSRFGLASPFFSEPIDALTYAQEKIFQLPLWESLKKRFDVLISQDEIIEEIIYQTDNEVYIRRDEVWSNFNEFK